MQQRSRIKCTVIVFLSMTAALFSRDVISRRQYEPVVLKGSQLSAFSGFPVEEIHLYSYHAAADAWRMIPFQIDEVALAPDPFLLPDTVMRYSYFVPDDGLFDHNDELVFMVADLGDPAGDAWLNDSGSAAYSSIELQVYAPDDSTDIGYAYLYRSGPQAGAVPRPWEFSYDTQQHRLSNRNFTLGLDPSTGILRDIEINRGGQPGVDIFDTQKLRFAGLLDLGGGFPIEIGRGDSYAANERDNLYLYQPGDGAYHYHEATADPVVRLIREVRQTIRFGTMRLDDIAFYVQARFYPHSSSVSGGARLDPDELKELFNTENEVYVELDLLRQSWDFNPQAAGMQFYNPRNSAVPVDGIEDTLDTAVSLPIQEWSMTTGSQGTVFIWTQLADTAWNSASVYYHDSLDSISADGATVPGGDTGDTLSWGDQGILLRNLAQRSANLELGFTAFFLEGAHDLSSAGNLARQMREPVRVRALIRTRPVSVDEQRTEPAPSSWLLSQNFPNPFNGETVIRYRPGRAGQVRLSIYSVTGRKVKTLVDAVQGPGLQRAVWDGTDDDGAPVKSGVYLYTLQNSTERLTRKLTLIR